jgi:hypothetical protein
MSFNEIVGAELGKNPNYTLEDLRQPTFQYHVRRDTEGRGVVEDTLHHSVLAHAIYCAVYYVKVAFCRTSIELAVFDFLLLAGNVWPKPLDPALTFFERLLDCIEVRWLLARVRFMLKACEALRKANDGQIKWSSSYLADADYHARAYNF